MASFDLDLTAQSAGLDAALSRRGCAASRFTLEWHEQLESTNTTLLLAAENGAASGTVVIAQTQSAGRGRRGRVWHAAPGDSVTFSLLWRFPPGTSPAGLSLAVGVALMRALSQVGAGNTAILGAKNAPSLTLKWPNDMLLDGRKLAGVLIELVSGQPHSVVIGVGFNLRLPADMPDDVRARSAAWPTEIDEGELLASMLIELGLMCDQFSAQGFAPFCAPWQAHHAYQNQRVQLTDDFNPPRSGICRGVARDGALLLEAASGQIERIIAGEVSLRAEGV
jgi:BirA family transcriptional regulator, biotin operon repressor / biotin---[acetyl-CoA-carboxylase] ligase